MHQPGADGRGGEGSGGEERGWHVNRNVRRRRTYGLTRRGSLGKEDTLVEGKKRGCITINLIARLEAEGSELADLSGLFAANGTGWRGTPSKEGLHIAQV